MRAPSMQDPGFGAGAGGFCCRVEFDANYVILIGQQWIIIFQTAAVAVKRMRSAKIS